MSRPPVGALQHAGEGLELLPGVLPLLEALAARDDVAVALVTGNLEPIGCAGGRRQDRGAGALARVQARFNTANFPIRPGRGM